jgi:hypothetical protein
VQSATISGSMITFNWGGIANVSYQIQSASDLGNPDWKNVGSPVAASGDLVSVSEPFSTATSQQFYRVIMLLAP